MDELVKRIPDSVLIGVGVIALLGFGPFCKFVWHLATAHSRLVQNTEDIKDLKDRMTTAEKDIDGLGEVLETPRALDRIEKQKGCNDG